MALHQFGTRDFNPEFYRRESSEAGWMRRHQAEPGRAGSTAMHLSHGHAGGWEPFAAPPVARFLHGRIWDGAKWVFEQITEDTSLGGPIGPAPTSADPGRNGCFWPWKEDPISGECIPFMGAQPGPDPNGAGDFPGGAVQGRFGAATVPAVHDRIRRSCPPGSALGKDNLCYESLTNKERKWPRGRRPLLTGGQRNAITKAKGAARAIANTAKDLQDMGMLPKARSRKSKGGHAKAVPIVHV